MKEKRGSKRGPEGVQMGVQRGIQIGGGEGVGVHVRGRSAGSFPEQPLVMEPIRHLRDSLMETLVQF